jgi:hypothetical protein
VADAGSEIHPEYFVRWGAEADREEQVARAVDRKAREYAAEQEQKASRLWAQRALQLREAGMLE